MNFSLLNEQAIAQIQLNQYISQQADSSAPENPQKISNGMRDVVNEAAQDFLDMSQLLVEQALHMGQTLLRMKTDLKKDEYQVFLTQIGWTTSIASKYIKLAKTFEGFAIAQLRRLDLNTLFALCRSTYSSLVEQMRDMAEVTQAHVEQLMKAVRPAKKTQSTNPVTGWKQCPSGGGRYYNVLLHDEQAGVSIEQQAEAQGVLPQKIIAEAIALYVQYKTSAVNQVWLEIDAEKLKQSETWAEVEATTGRNKLSFNRILRQWSLEERQRLIPILARHLLQNSQNRVENLLWVPQELLLKALSTAGLLHPKYFAA